MRKSSSLAIGILLLAASPACAMYRLILCDTAEQIEEVFTLHTEAISFDEAIKAVNAHTGKTNACSKATVEATLLEEVRDITVRQNFYTIIKVAVTAVSDGEHMLPVPYLEQFAVMPGKMEADPITYKHRQRTGSQLGVQTASDFGAVFWAAVKVIRLSYGSAT